MAAPPHRAVELVFEATAEVLRVTVDGTTATFAEVARLLFAHYLRAKLRENVDDHVWTFRVGGRAAHPAIPILSPDLQSCDLYSSDFLSDPNIPPPGVLAAGARRLSLEVGQDLRFTYDEGNPTVLACRVQSIHDVTDAQAALLPTAVRPPPPPVEFTAAEVAESASYRARKAAANEREFSRSQQRVIPWQAPTWEYAELEAVDLLIKAGLTFTKAWNTYLEHALLLRTKATSSGKWCVGVWLFCPSTLMHSY
jgi:hypothetical protein